mmetsp:Transcript_10311/g.24758  ORF Transcript_10311/g.24758 Transcript_10311/m.24758 type:complete len:85 (-) Transcript_10311:275-529(-)
MHRMSGQPIRNVNICGDAVELRFENVANLARPAAVNGVTDPRRKMGVTRNSAKRTTMETPSSKPSSPLSDMLKLRCQNPPLPLR